MHYENDVCGSQGRPGIFHNFDSHKSIQLTDLSNITTTRSHPKELPLYFCWLPWLMTETKGLQYSCRQTSTKIHLFTVIHRLTRCFLHSCLRSWQDKIISSVQFPYWNGIEGCMGEVSRKSERRKGMRPQSVPRNLNRILFLGEEGKGIWPVPEWFCSPSCLKLSCLYLKTVSWLTAQPHLSAGWGLSILWDTHYEDALTQFSLPASLSHMAHRM